MKKLWRKLFPIKTVMIPYESHSKVSHALCVGSSVYFVMYDGTLFTLDVATQLWSKYDTLSRFI